MVRPRGATQLAEQASGSDRLQSMGLRPSTGWVPETAALPARPEHAEGAVAGTAWGPVADSATTGSGPARDRRPPTSELARAWVTDRLPPWTHGLVERATPGSVVAAVAVLVGIVVAAVVVLHHHSAPGYPSAYHASAGPSGSSGSFASPLGSAVTPVAPVATSLVVDVGGRVRKPGLVTLPPGARVADAVAAAGGPLRHRDIATMNMAARVADGQLLLVGATTAAPGAPSAAAGGSGSASPSAPISLSTATLDQLETLPGIGPVTGQKIIDWRSAHGGFTSTEQLQQVSGIGPATYADLAPLVSP